MNIFNKRLKPRINIQRVLSLLLVIVLAGTLPVKAQLSSFHAMYFQDQYLVNPAMAGIEGGLKINVGYQSLNTNAAGSPTAKYVTADYAAGERMGLGVLVNSDQAGLISRTRIMGTYAYHIHLNETDRLSMGLSVGINNSHFNTDQVVGDQNDQSGALYNARPTYVDGDFGIAYTTSQITVQGAVPNLRSVFFKKADQLLAPYRSSFFASIGYKVELNGDGNSTTIEPKIAYRGFKDLDGVIDLGANLSMINNQINISAMYHTNQSASIGVGLGIKQVSVSFAYTNDMGPFRTFAANTFELGLKFNLLGSDDSGSVNAH